MFTMKNLKQIMLFVMTITMVSLTSCSKDDDGGNTGPAASGTITAKVNGSQFTSIQAATFATLATGGGQTTLILQGNTSTQGVSFTVNGYNGVGTYEISNSNVFIVATYIEPNVSDPANSQTWSAPFQDSGIVGELNISEETDTMIKGTFSFTGKNSNDDSTKNITEGSFNVNKM
jgi:hypothetical protein